MEGSPDAKQVPKSPKKPGASKSGSKTPRSPKGPRKQVEPPNPPSQRGKSSAPKRLGRPNSAKLQDGEAAVQGAPPEASTPSSADILLFRTDGKDTAAAYQPAASQPDAIQGQLSRDQEREDAKAPAKTESVTLLPTSSDSLATGVGDLPVIEGKAPGSSVAATDLGRVPSSQEQPSSVAATETKEVPRFSGHLATIMISSDGLEPGRSDVPVRSATGQTIDTNLQPLKPVASETTLTLESEVADKAVQPEEPAPIEEPIEQPANEAEPPNAQEKKRKGGGSRRPERRTDQKQRNVVDAQGSMSNQPALQAALSEEPTPVALDSLNATGDQGKASGFPISTTEPVLASSLPEQPPSGHRMDDPVSTEDQAFVPISSDGSEIRVKVVQGKQAKELDGALSSKEQLSGGQGKEDSNMPVPDSGPSSSTLETNQREPGRIIGAQFQTKTRIVDKPTPNLESKKSETPSPPKCPGPNLRRISPEANSRSPVAFQQIPEKPPVSPSPWTGATKRSCSTSVCSTVIVVTVATVALLAFVLTRGQYEKKQQKTCDTLACKAYSSRLLDSINTSVDPCESFTHYICDGWRRDHKVSVNEDTVRAALDRLHNMVADLKVSDSGRSSLERAAVFYRSCQCVGRGSCDQLPQVLSALAEAGIVWPRKARGPDVLHTVLFTSLQLRWGGVFSFEITARGREKRVMLRTADELHLLKRKMDEQLRVSKDRRKRYFEVLKNQFGAAVKDIGKEDALVSFEETLHLEVNLFSNLWKSAYSTPIRSLEGYLVYETVENVTEKRWKDTFKACGVPLGPEDTLVFSSDAEDFVFHFIMIWQHHGDEAVHLFVSWFAVQVAALFSNQQLLVNFYGSQATAELGHGLSCFGKTFLIIGNDVLYGYSSYFLPDSVRPAAKELVLDVRQAFHRRLLSWEHYSENATVVHDWNSTTVALTYFNEAGPRNSSGQKRTALQRRTRKQRDDDKATPAFKSDSLVANWRLAVQDLLNDPTSLSLSEAVENRDQYMLRTSGDESPDVALLPYAFTFPYFAQDAMRAFNYAGVGSLVAEALSRLFVDAYLRSTRTTRVVEVFTECMEESVPDKLSRRNYGRHMEPVSLRVALEAYRADGEKLRNDLRVVGLESLSTEQLFFVAACFTRCTGRKDTGRTAQVQCDDTFRHVPEFATVFKCKPGAAMNPEKRCKLL